MPVMAPAKRSSLPDVAADSSDDSPHSVHEVTGFDHRKADVMSCQYAGSFAVAGQDHQSRSEFVRQKLEKIHISTRRNGIKEAYLVISETGVKLCSSNDPLQASVLMAHALRRISYATCDPEKRLFAFVSREPKGHFSLQYCHAFITIDSDQAEELNNNIGNAFKIAFARQFEPKKFPQPSFHDVIQQNIVAQEKKLKKDKNNNDHFYDKVDNSEPNPEITTSIPSCDGKLGEFEKNELAANSWDGSIINNEPNFSEELAQKSNRIWAKKEKVQHKEPIGKMNVNGMKNWHHDLRINKQKQMLIDAKNRAFYVQNRYGSIVSSTSDSSASSDENNTSNPTSPSKYLNHNKNLVADEKPLNVKDMRLNYNGNQKITATNSNISSSSDRLGSTNLPKVSSSSDVEKVSNTCDNSSNDCDNADSVKWVSSTSIACGTSYQSSEEKIKLRDVWKGHKYGSTETVCADNKSDTESKTVYVDNKNDVESKKNLSYGNFAHYISGRLKGEGSLTPPPPLPQRHDSLTSEEQLDETLQEEELRMAPWFQAGIPREIALEVLGQEPIGAFMVRSSTTRPDCFALSLRVPKTFQPTGIAHYLVLQTNRGYKIKGFTKEFSSLTALITHHSVMPEMLPVPLSLSRYNANYVDNDSSSSHSKDEDDPDYETLSDFRKIMAELNI